MLRCRWWVGAAGLALALVCSCGAAGAADPAAAGAQAERPRLPAIWDSWRPFLGDWIGEGGGEVGQGTGGFHFAGDLDGRILLKRNWAEYPATKDRPAFRHDDLMLVYREAAAAGLRALYLDNEGHAIHYAAACSAGGDTLTFLSDRAPSAPRFRLTYVRVGRDSLALRFEIAPPGEPESFSVYTQGIVRRKPPGGKPE